MWLRLGRVAAMTGRARGGLAADTALYAGSAAFAGYTALASTLPTHRVWGAIAIAGYALATGAALIQLLLYRTTAPARRSTKAPGRAWVVGLTWLTTALVPLVVEAYQRAAGTAGRAQEEVIVIEDGARRLVETGTPYLDRAAIAALPEAERLLGYLPYQPAMASFGLARAADPTGAWWSDARIWFAVATALALGAALLLLRRTGVDPARLIRAAQVATVLPLCALTLATGGDDLPVLALCLLALALTAVRRWGWAGVAVGAAAALKLFAWPVALVLAVLALAQYRTAGNATGRRPFLRFSAGVLSLPVLTLLPVLSVNADALVENVLRFPLGHGLVTSPAQSPLPGYLIAQAVPDGRYIALGLLGAVGLGIAGWLIGWPPRTTAAAASVIGLGLLAALLLLPSTRFGYLLYPAAFLIWAGCLRGAPTPARPNLPRVPTQRPWITQPQPAPSKPAG